MQFAELSRFIPTTWQTMPFEQWESELRSICGNFRPRARAERVTGTVRVTTFGGLELAQVASDLEYVRRDQSDIDSDYGEHLFLLMQIEGMCGVEQRGVQSILAPGDCILVDSAMPSLFQFGGRFSNSLSVHLPRQLLFSQSCQLFEVARRLPAADPMAVTLYALIAKLLRTSSGDERAAHLRQLLFDTVGEAFPKKGNEDARRPCGSSAARIELTKILIDKHLTDERLTPQWLADRLGISLRTLQEDLNAIGATATALIRRHRLLLARQRLAIMKNDANCATIAEVAYASGFNDISYFNRCFKKAFDCSPKEVLHR